MQNIIYKYELPVKNEFTLKMTNGKILSLQEQFDRPNIWVLEDTNAPEVERHFICQMTGHEFETNDNATYQYIGSVQMGHGSIMGVLVAHYFEVFPNAA